MNEHGFTTEAEENQNNINCDKGGRYRHRWLKVIEMNPSNLQLPFLNGCGDSTHYLIFSVALQPMQAAHETVVPPPIR